MQLRYVATPFERLFYKYNYTFTITPARGGCRASVADLTKPPSWIIEKPILQQVQAKTYMQDWGRSNLPKCSAEDPSSLHVCIGAQKRSNQGANRPPPHSSSYYMKVLGASPSVS